MEETNEEERVKVKAGIFAQLDGQALETIPIMEYVWQRTNPELVSEELQRGQG